MGKKQASAGSLASLQTSPGIGDPSAIAPVELFCIYFRGLSLRLCPHTSTDGGCVIPTFNLNFVETRKKKKTILLIRVCS